MNCNIRCYIDDDFAAVCHMEGAGSDEPYTQAVFIRQSAVLFPETFLVADMSGVTAGYTIGALVQDDPSRAWILRMGVFEEWRRQKIGETLLLSVIDSLRNKGAGEIYLTVSPANIPALNMYRKHGFEITGRVNNYFGEGEDRFIMKTDFLV